MSIKQTKVIARFLLGLIFLIFGLNGFQRITLELKERPKNAPRPDVKAK